MTDHSNKLKVEFLSGIIGASISTTLLQPLDIARTRTTVQIMSRIKNRYKGFIHTFQTIIKEEGLKGLYIGYRVSIISNPTFHSIFFSTYELSKVSIQKYFYGREQITNQQKYMIDSASSFVAGILTDTVTNPLWIARLRIQTQHLNDSKKYTKLIPTLFTIYREEGVKNGLFKGLLVSYIGVIHPIIYFPIYEQIKQFFRDGQNHELLTHQIVTSSLVAKSLAIILTFPHIIIRNRIQFYNTQLMSKNVANRGMGGMIIQVIQMTYNKQGIRGFYTGLNFEIFRILPQNTLIFWIYEKTKAKLTDYYNIH